LSSQHADDDVVSLESLQSLAPGSGHDPRVVEAVEAWCGKHAGTCAGLVLSADTVYVGFTRDAREHLDALRTAFPGAKIKTFAAKHTYGKLRATVDRISHDLPALRKEGIAIWSVGIDPSRNVVVISLDRSGADLAANELATRYGPDVLSFDFAGPRHLADAAGTSN